MATNFRQLTEADWPTIEGLLDTRKTFQTQPVTDQWHSAMKANTLTRLKRRDHFLFGAFVDGVLQAVTVFMSQGDHASMGLTASRAGQDLPKWPNSTHYSQAVIGLMNFVADWLDTRRTRVLWVVGPAESGWERLVDAPGSAFADPTRYSRTTVTVVGAYTKSTEPFIRDWVMNGHTFAQDQTVFNLTNLRAPPLTSAPPTNSEMPVPTRPTTIITTHPVPRT